VLGLLIIPEWGISLPSFIGGSIVLVASLSLLVKKRRIAGLTVFLVLGLLVTRVNNTQSEDGGYSLKILHHSSEGVMGQIKVVDFGWKFEEDFTPARAVLVNNTWQTALSMESGLSLLSYVYHLLPIIETFPEESDMLVIGLGGGGLIREMQQSGYFPDIVELDSRLPEITEEFFGLDLGGKIIVDDGRHFLNVNDKMYDLVVLDVFQGEVAPWQLFTLEAFETIKHTLTSNGLLAIEFFGNIDRDNEARALASIIKTLKQASYNEVQVIEVAEDEKLILANKGNALDLKQVGYSGPYFDSKDIRDLSQWLIDAKRLELQDAPILTDNLPALERMTLKSAKSWRAYQNKMFRDNFLKVGEPAVQ